MNKTCEAGVTYRDLSGGGLHKLPCIAKYATADSTKCDKREEPTQAEIAEVKREMEALDRRVDKMLTFAAQIRRDHKGQNAKGGSPCPVCGKTLHWTHAATNGLVWGKCETPDCLAWME